MIEKPPSCLECSLYNSTEGIVWGEGPTDADMMFIGEAPGEEEGSALMPFVGGSGRVLNGMLAHAQIDRRKIFLTNTVKCRPTTRDAFGKIVNRQPTDHEIRCCAPLLLGEIQKVNPNILVALGNIPMRTITGTKKGILLTRSVPTEGNKRQDGKANRYKVVGTLHPAFVMRQQEMWPAAIFDLVRARTESTTPVISRRPWKRHIHTHLADVRDALERRIRTPRIGGYCYYHHDLETTGLDPRKDTFRCIGVAAESDEVFCFDWTLDVIEWIASLHRDPKLLTVGQNSEGFDIPFQEAKGFEFNGPTYDTLIGFHLLNSALPKDLGFIGACVTDELYWKDDTMYRSGEDALQTGCCKDIHATGRAFEEQMKEMEITGVMDLYFKQIMPLQPVLRRMTQRGLRKDVRKAAGWHVVLNRKADEYEEKLKRGMGDATFEVESPKQLMDLLYRRMGLPVQYRKNADGIIRPTVDAQALDELAKISNNPILLLIRSIRTLRKWDSTFVCCDQDENGFVHGHFSCAKAANGRLNSYDPNMQNFPIEVREILIPDDEDCVLVSRDWSQIEWRIAMALAGDRVGLDALAAGRDVHQDAWSNVWGVPYETVTKRERFEAKRYNYGLLYGRGEESLATGGAAGTYGVAIPREKVHEYFVGFWNKYQGYDKLRKVITADVANKHFITTAWGRRRYWFTRSQMPEAYNYPIQGSAAHMMYEALVELEAQLPLGATLRLTVHDEVVINSTKDRKTLKQTIECTRDVMEREFRQIRDASLYPEVVDHYFPNGWRCESDCHIGPNWKIVKGDNKEDLAVEAEMRKLLGVEDCFPSHD